jgi:hypothetical protein
MGSVKWPYGTRFAKSKQKATPELPEPVVKRLVLEPWRCWKMARRIRSVSTEQLHIEIANLAAKHNLPMQMLLDVYREHRSEPIAKRVFTDWARKAHLQFDEQLFMAVMKVFRARTMMNQAAAEVIQSEVTLLEAQWKESTTPQTWAAEAERKEDLAQAQHETELARLAAERRGYENEGQPPAPVRSEPQRSRAERVLSEVEGSIARTVREETGKEAKKEIARHAFMARIIAAEAIDGDKELAEFLRHKMEVYLDDIGTHEA